MNEYTNQAVASSRNADLARKARTARVTSKNTSKKSNRGWFARGLERLARPLTLAGVN
jgi:hypothetical protein